MQEDDTVQLYYSTENTREFKEVEEQNLEVVAIVYEICSLS